MRVYSFLHFYIHFRQTVSEETARFRLPKFLVNRGVVGHHRGVADKQAGFTHDPGHGWSRCDHGVGDACDAGHSRRNPPASVHQTLVTVDNLTVTQKPNGDLSGSVAAVGLQDNGFKVQYGDRLPDHAPRRSFIGDH